MSKNILIQLLAIDMEMSQIKDKMNKINAEVKKLHDNFEEHNLNPFIAFIYLTNLALERERLMARANELISEVAALELCFEEDITLSE